MAAEQMGGSELSDNKSEESGKNRYAFCKSVTASGVKCSACYKMYHNSCAIKVIGLNVIGRGIVECCKESGNQSNLQET